MGKPICINVGLNTRKLELHENCGEDNEKIETFSLDDFKLVDEDDMIIESVDGTLNLFRDGFELFTTQFDGIDDFKEKVLKQIVFEG